jgi:hypothetical protein
MDRDALFEVRLRARNASALRRSSARQEAEALFKPKRQPVEPSVSDSVPSAERSARKPRVLPISSPALCRPVKAAASAGWGRTIIFWKIGAALARCEKGLSGAAQAAF